MRNICLRISFLLALGGLFAGPARAHVGTGIAVDAQGRVWFVDAVGNHLWRIESDGRLSLVARGIHFNLLVLGPGGEAYVRNDNASAGAPAGLLKIDAAGQVTRITDPHVVEEIAGPSLPKAASLAKANSVAQAPDGSFFVRDCGVIRKVAPDGKVSELIGGPTAGSLGHVEDCTRVVGMAVDRAGNLYVANYGQAVVFEVTPSGEARVILRSTWPWAPVAVAHAGDALLVVERYGNPYGPTVTLSSLPGRKLRVRKLGSDAKVALLATVR